jgi:antigen 43
MIMKRILSVLAIGMLGAWTASAQTTASTQTGATAQTQTSAQTNASGAQASGNASAATSSSTVSSTLANNNAANNTAPLADGTKVDGSLATSLDAKRSKVGDEVEVRTEEDIKQDGKVILKKGTHLVGHVSQTQARANGQTESQLGIVFDHAVLKNGQQVPFNATILAMASAQSASAASMDANDLASSGAEMRTGQATARTSGGLAGGVASTANATAGAATGTVVNTASTMPVNAGSTLNAATHSSGAVGGLNANGRLASNSSGVFGLEGVSINSAASNATQGSMIVSSTKNVHLDSGTQLLLRTNAQAQ